MQFRLYFFQINDHILCAIRARATPVHAIRSHGDNSRGSDNKDGDTTQRILAAVEHTQGAARNKQVAVARNIQAVAADNILGQAHLH